MVIASFGGTKGRKWIPGSAFPCINCDSFESQCESKNGFFLILVDARNVNDTEPIFIETGFLFETSNLHLLLPGLGETSICEIGPKDRLLFGKDCSKELDGALSILAKVGIVTQRRCKRNEK
eukprot:Gb_32021 [translate_table: standard]